MKAKIATNMKKNMKWKIKTRFYKNNGSGLLNLNRKNLEYKSPIVF